MDLVFALSFFAPYLLVLAGLPLAISVISLFSKRVPRKFSLGFAITGASAVVALVTALVGPSEYLGAGASNLTAETLLVTLVGLGAMVVGPVALWRQLPISSGWKNLWMGVVVALFGWEALVIGASHGLTGQSLLFAGLALLAAILAPAFWVAAIVSWIRGALTRPRAEE